ncbi:MAG: septum formation protein Maf [Candidatus Aegiribacteria sp.]|nr:septum formation protein Maf [Candidatus Aegiribacteria sp.]
MVLASRSPRRKAILEMAGIPYVQAPGNIDESDFSGSPSDVVLHWARMKASDILPSWKGHPVLGADTMVVLGDKLLGKPEDAARAFDMLTQLSGKWHSVYGGVCIIWPEKGIDIGFVETTRVRFRTLSVEEIRMYVSSGEPMDKAGAYGIQGLGCALVDRVDGCYFNVMGLPISRLVHEFKIRLMNGV